MIPIEERIWFFWRKIFKDIKNLIKLSSLGYTNGYYAGVPRISKKQIAEYKENLIAVTAGIYGDVPNAIFEFRGTKKRKFFLWWKEQFGDDFYVQIQNHDIEEERALKRSFIRISR